MSDSQSVVHTWSKRKRRLVKLLLVAASVLVGLLVAEIALRAVGYTFPDFYTVDAARGYALRPGMRS